MDAIEGCALDFMRSKITFNLFMFALLITLTTLIVLRYESLIKQFEGSQTELMQLQAQQAASSIDREIHNIRGLMSAISIDNLWLSDFADFSKETIIQEALANKFKLYFPKMMSYVVADKTGQRIGGDNDFFIDHVCQSDINHVAQMFKPETDYFEYQPYIHPKPDFYHFDMMMPVYAKGRELIFFMSFDAEWLRKALSTNALTDHFMYLLREDVEGLIEVTPNAVRDKLSREIKLSVQELKNMGALIDVPHTKWQVAVVKNPQIRNSFTHQLRLESFTAFTLLVFFWGIIYWLGMRYENSRIRHIHVLDKLSHQDDLTKLYNRRKLISEINYAIKAAKEMHQYSALLYIDLNDFKLINDVHGHDNGDKVLIECAKRLKNMTRANDVVARLGGDEFVVLLNELGDDIQKAERVLHETEARLRSQLSKHYTLGDMKEQCPPSIGEVLIAPDSDLQAEDWLSKVDAKMYENKQKLKQAT